MDRPLEDKSLTPVMIRIVLEMEEVARIDFPAMEVAMVLDAGSMRRPFAGGDDTGNLVGGQRLDGAPNGLGGQR